MKVMVHEHLVMGHEHLVKVMVHEHLVMGHEHLVEVIDGT